MSNKLYTEDQVKKALWQTQHPFSDGENVDEIINSLTPIELPTDEEIFQKSIEIMEEWYGNGCKTEIDAHFRGAKWMKSKIQVGNNEQ